MIVRKNSHVKIFKTKEDLISFKSKIDGFFTAKCAFIKYFFNLNLNTITEKGLMNFILHSIQASIKTKEMRGYINLVYINKGNIDIIYKKNSISNKDINIIKQIINNLFYKKYKKKIKKSLIDRIRNLNSYNHAEFNRDKKYKELLSISN